MPGPNPTVQRRRLGTELRRLREAAQLTREQVAEHMEWSNAKVWRIETGKVGVRARDVKDLCDLYQAPTEMTKVLESLAKEARASRRSWWHAYNDVIPDWFSVYVELEGAASSISAYEAELIPGLLQTEDYARTIHRAMQVETPDGEIERQVALRMQRQQLLTRSDPSPPRLWAIVNEAALRRPVGSRDAMRAQLEHLRELAARPNVTLQVLPFDAGAHASMINAFSILGFPDSQDPSVVYIESLTGALYLEKPHEVDRYNVAFDHLKASALNTTASAALINRVAKEL